jgi:hypothetical protein
MLLIRVIAWFAVLIGAELALAAFYLSGWVY